MILALDTTSRICTVALASDQGVMAEFSLGIARAHSRWLIPALSNLLDDTGVKVEALDAIAVTTGPGSFTGLRIGVTTAKMLAYVWQLPVCPMGTLEVLSQGVMTPEIISPVVMARKGEVYAALYHKDCLKQPHVVGEGEWLNYLQSLERPIVVVGDALERGELFSQEELGGQVEAAPMSLRYPRAAVVAQLGLEAFRQGRGIEPMLVTASYLKKSQAEVMRERKLAQEE